eukprot:10055126-Ditylum_brightwellii.AAC.1
MVYCEKENTNGGFGNHPPCDIQFQKSSDAGTMPPLDEETQEEEEVLKVDFFLTSKEMPEHGAM